MALKRKNSVEKTPVAEKAVEPTYEDTSTEVVAAETVVEAPVEASTTAPVEPEVSAPVEASQVATTQPAEPTQVAVTQNGPASVGASLEAQGAHGLELDWTSFETIVLDKGEFCTSDGEELEVDASTGFDVIIMRTEEKFALRSSVEHVH